MKETRICANCGAEHPIDEMFQVGTDWLCDDCGRIIHRDRAYWDNDDNTYCASCWDEHSEVIHEYSYTPDLVFHGKGLRHFGVELEIDDGGTVRHPPHPVRTDEPRKEFLRRTLHGGQPYELGHG